MAAYVYNLHILRARVKFLVDIIARRKVRVEFRLSQVHFRVPVVPLFLHQNTIIYPGKCGPFGNLGGCVRTRRTPLRTGLKGTTVSSVLYQLFSRFVFFIGTLIS